MKKRGIPRKLLYIFTLFAVIQIFALSLPAQVNIEELRGLEPVEFINFEGPHFRIETRSQIREIGYILGQAIRAGAAQTGTLSRYFVINSVSTPEGLRLNADIFGIGSDAAVDHIRNLRLIIQGYLEAAYQYSESDAALLAEYITIYNAVNRGDWAFFSDRFNSPVLGHLSRERVGLAIRYDDWPGQTLMVIPLGSGLGGALSALDTSALSDFRVIEYLRLKPEMGLALRKDMIALMEREADYAVFFASLIRQTIHHEQQWITGEQQLLGQELARLALERRRPGADIPAINEMVNAVELQQASLSRRLQELETQRQQAEKREAFAEQRITLTRQERRQIAQDQQAMLNSELPVAHYEGVLGINIVNPNTATGRFVLLDDSGRITRQSALNTVNIRTATIINNRVFAIAGENRGRGAIRLVEINGSTLEMQRQGDSDIAPESLIWVNGQDIYALISSSGNHNLARFNTDLVLQARSSLEVHPNATVFFIDGSLMTQRSDGTAVILNSRDLSERR